MKMKRILAAVLAATMVMASALTASAATTTVSGGSGSTDTGSSESSQPSAFEILVEKSTVKADVKMNIGKFKIKTSVAGVYAAESVEGCAIISDLADITAVLGLKPGQTPKVLVFDTDMKKSYLAKASIDAAANALGATVVTAINVDLGAVQDNKWVELEDGSIVMMAGLPKTADLSKTYAVVCVQSGGAISVFNDVDTIPETITFPVNAGLGTYAIVAY